MNLIDQVKESKRDDLNPRLHSAPERHFEVALNRLFSLQSEPEEESAFLNKLLSDKSERQHLHASDLLKAGNDYCLRQLVLLTLFKQPQRKSIGVGTLRTWAIGDSIHQMYQRLFIRGGWSCADDLDKTKVYKGIVHYSIDAVCFVDEFEKDLTIEIKSQETNQFQKLKSHYDGVKQCNLYNCFDDRDEGFVLVADKNTQAQKIIHVKKDIVKAKPIFNIIDEVIKWHNIFIDKKRIPMRPDGATIECTKCSRCKMRNVCYEINKKEIERLC